MYTQKNVSIHPHAATQPRRGRKLRTETRRWKRQDMGDEPSKHGGMNMLRV